MGYYMLMMIVGRTLQVLGSGYFGLEFELYIICLGIIFLETESKQYQFKIIENVQAD